MIGSSTCPTPEAIEDLVGNRLAADLAETIRTHVQACPDCQQRLSGKSTRQPGEAETIVSTPPLTHPALSPPKAPGELGWLAEYRITGVLGEGGMAIVYDAEEPKLGRQVALKVLKTEINDPASRERFLREARLVASLTSDRVVHVYAVGEANGVPFLAMEKLRGETLANRLKRDRWLPVADSLGIAREAAEGLGALHQRGLIHRDVKPDNLWLESDADGKVTRVKLIDFGIARQVTGDPSLTMPGQVIGTPIYMAPEQATGGAIDSRVDLYSLGCVLYRMIAGKTAFENASPSTLAVLSAVIRSEITPIREAVPNLSGRVVELIDGLMARDPNNRPATATQLAERLRELEHEERSSTSKTKMIQEIASHSRQKGPRRAGPLSVTVGVLAILAALAVGLGAVVMKLWPSLLRTSVAENRPGGEQKPVVTPPVTPLPVIKVGVLFSQSDSMASHELPLIDAVQLAIDEINESGGVLGRKLQPIVEDGASSAKVFEKKAVKLIDEDQVAVIFGGGNSAARKRVAEVCGELKRDRLLFYPHAYEGLEEYESVVYLGGTPNQLLTPLVKFAYADLRKRRVFLIGDDSVYSQAIGAMLGHEVKQLEALVVGSRVVTPGDTQMKPLVDEIKNSKADFVISSLSGGDNVALFRAMRAAKLQPPTVTSAWLSVSEPDLIHYPPSLEGDYTAGSYFESQETPANASFVQRYRKRFGASKRVSDTMESAYASVYVWKKAVEKADSVRTWDVRVAVRGLSVDTPDGPLKIDPLTLHAWRTGRIGKVISDDGRLAFRSVQQTSGAVEPVLFPSWKTPAEWKQWLSKLPTTGNSQ